MVRGIVLANKDIQQITRTHKVCRGTTQHVSMPSTQEHRHSRKGVRPVVDSDRPGCKIWLMSDAEGTEEALKDVKGDRVEVPVKATAANYTSFEILTELLPKGMTVPSSFEAVGHIAHLNLKEEHHPYRFLIGKVLLDKNPGIKSVVNKLGTIDSVYREFQFELLAGDSNMNAVVKQHGCTFEFAYDKVYWNSRLQTEHTRLVDLIPVTDILCDVMGGVGPFAVPAAKQGVTVHCNDLNPASYDAMKRNAEINHVRHRMKSYNMDGRAFIHKMRDELLTASPATEGATKPLPTIHFTMNLPATAVEFLDAFQGWSSTEYDTHRAQVHVYCFSSATDFLADALVQAKHFLGHAAATIHEASVHHVRNVAPKKEMLCVSFSLTSPPEASAQRKRKRDAADDGGDLR